MNTASPFIVHLEIRWSDQDLMGHVNNARIVTLVEETRIRWMIEGRGGRDIAEWPELVAHLDLSYRRPVVYGPRLTIELGVRTVGRTSYTVAFRGAQDGETVFEGSTVMVRVDPTTGRPAAITEEERGQLAAFAIDEDTDSD